MKEFRAEYTPIRESRGRGLRLVFLDGGVESVEVEVEVVVDDGGVAPGELAVLIFLSGDESGLGSFS